MYSVYFNVGTKRGIIISPKDFAVAVMTLVEHFEKRKRKLNAPAMLNSDSSARNGECEEGEGRGKE